MTAGVSAGGHLDQDKTGRHLGPEGKGHLGDLPVLTVSSDGTARQAVVAPRLKIADLRNRAYEGRTGTVEPRWRDVPPCEYEIDNGKNAERKCVVKGHR
jgi:hypothetical protein